MATDALCLHVMKSSRLRVRVIMPCRQLKVELRILAENNNADAIRLRLQEDKRKSREAVLRRNPILVYAEKLAASDESAWKDNLECMGNTPDIPRLFRHAGKVQCLALKFEICAAHPAHHLHIPQSAFVTTILVITFGALHVAGAK